MVLGLGFWGLRCWMVLGFMVVGCGVPPGSASGHPPVERLGP